MHNSMANRLHYAHCEDGGLKFGVTEVSSGGIELMVGKDFVASTNEAHLQRTGARVYHQHPHGRQ